VPRCCCGAPAAAFVWLDLPLPPPSLPPCGWKAAAEPAAAAACSGARCRMMLEVWELMNRRPAAIMSRCQASSRAASERAASRCA